MNQTQTILKTIRSIPGQTRVKAHFERRVREGRLTRDENPLTHLTVYFAGYDPQVHEVFIGRHIKSGQWLFTGGHLDRDEVPHEALKREIGEEWGKGFSIRGAIKPNLLTITKIANFPVKRLCKFHYDIWYFMPLKKDEFKPDQSLLAKEFHEILWLGFKEARQRVTDPSTLTALRKIESFRSKLELK